MTKLSAKRAWRNMMMSRTRYNPEMLWAAGVKARVPIISMLLKIYGNHAAKRLVLGQR